MFRFINDFINKWHYRRGYKYIEESLDTARLLNPHDDFVALCALGLLDDAKKEENIDRKRGMLEALKGWQEH